MVDLQENQRGNESSKRSEGKVKILMDRTPSYLKSKFLSVLGSSNDLISGLTTKLDISGNLSSSSDTNTNLTANRGDDISLDENIIDFESRKVKERRAHDEVSSGKYRHPNFVARSSKYHATTMTVKDSNMIDVNPESSISISNSNSMLSPSSLHTIGPEMGLQEFADNKTVKNVNTTNNQLTVHPTGAIISVSSSENEIQVPSISDGSIELKRWDRSNSDVSVQSVESMISLDSQTEDDTLAFMRRYVNILFEDSSQLTLELKSDFGLKSRTECGRLWFARLVSAQRSKSKRVSENSFFSLVQHFAIVLFECKESDDFSPAKILMNMCFTFFYEVDVPGCEPYREYTYIYLRDQPIWHALRFWNAAYFDAVQCERSHQNRPVPPMQLIHIPVSDSTDDDLSSGAHSVQRHLAQEVQNNLEMIRDDQEFQQNICFGQLGTFTCNMHAFGLSKELCDEFLRKQCVISNISEEQQRMLFDNINRMYKETAKWRAN